MTTAASTSPMTRRQAIDNYFMEHRAKLIDIAAYLDRLDRSTQDGENDFRDDAFRQALLILSDDLPHRAKRILLLLSDHTSELPQSAEGMKGAAGAPPVTATAGGAS